MATNRNYKVKGGLQKSRGAREAATRSMTPNQQHRLKPTEKPQSAAAEIMVHGLGMNALTAVAYSRNVGTLDLKECMAALVAQTRTVQRGNMDGMEAILAAQAVTLNAMFTQLAYQASRMDIVDQIDRFTRLAFKAQSQCRATLETLATIKNPATVFARQANIAHGPQQVNNTAVLSGQELSRARAENPEIEQNKLLEGYGERLERGTTDAAGSGDSTMAAVGALNRPTDS